MNKDYQLYLLFKVQLEERGASSGKSAQQIEQMVSELFSTRTGKVDSDEIRLPGTPFRFENVAEYISKQWNWQRRPSRELKIGKK